MLIDRSREKLINVIVFFATNVKHCGKTKLFKLLYFLDFQHFKEIGRSVTGLSYFAWQNGPVPVKLNEELEKPQTDLTQAVKIEDIPLPEDKKPMMFFTPKIEFYKGCFSKREFKIMTTLADEYKNSTAEEMIEATHLEKQPWHQVYEVEGRKLAPIPYELAINHDQRDVMKEIIAERQEMLTNYSDSRKHTSR